MSIIKKSGISQGRADNRFLKLDQTTPQSVINGVPYIVNGIKIPKIYPNADSTTAIQFNKANGTTNVLNIDTTNSRVEIGTTAGNIGNFGSLFTVASSTTFPIITSYRAINNNGSGTGFQSVMNNSAGNPVTVSYYNGYMIDNTAGAEKSGFYVSTRRAGVLTVAMRILDTGNAGFGVTVPTAIIHLNAGTATAGTAPLKFTSGTLNTIAEAGAVEFLTDDFYATQTTSTIRKKFLFNVGKITTVTDTYSVLTTDETVICNKATAFTVTLPVAVVGQRFDIKNIGEGTVTIDGNSTDLIDDVLTQDIEQWESVTLQCYAANKWCIL